MCIWYRFKDISHSAVCWLSNLSDYCCLVRFKFNRLVRLTIVSSSNSVSMNHSLHYFHHRVGFVLEESYFFQDTWKKLEKTGWKCFFSTFRKKVEEIGIKQKIQQELMFKTLFYLWLTYILHFKYIDNNIAKAII